MCDMCIGLYNFIFIIQRWKSKLLNIVKFVVHPAICLVLFDLRHIKVHVWAVQLLYTYHIQLSKQLRL